jgi:hypothetical protein
MEYLSMVTLMWHGSRPPGDPDEMDLLVIQDLLRNVYCIDKASDLITHTVFLSDANDGPSVLVWGEDGDDTQFHCEYHEVTRWISLKDIEEY